MNIKTEKIEDILLIHIDGRLDTLSANQLEQEVIPFIKEGNNKIGLNFTQVDYISSSGLRVVLIFTKALKKNNGKIALYALNDNINEVFKISGFATIIPIHKTQEEAVAFLSQ